MLGTLSIYANNKRNVGGTNGMKFFTIRECVVTPWLLAEVIFGIGLWIGRLTIAINAEHGPTKL